MNILGTIEKVKEKPMLVDEHARQSVREGNFGYDYWDNPEFPGHKGYYYDGRWKEPAKRLIDHFDLQPGSRVLDVGCGKGYLLYELKQWIPELEITGVDVSEYAIENGKPEIRDQLLLGSATDLPFPDDSFDLVISLAVVYMLPEKECLKAIQEIERVGRNKLIQVVSFRNEKEKELMTAWDVGLVRKSLSEWDTLYDLAGYTGDKSWFIFVEK